MLSFQPIPEVKFRKQMIAAESSETVGVFDEIVPNTPGKPLAYYTLIRDKNSISTGQFSRRQVAENTGMDLDLVKLMSL